jgi:YbbR domain-containing protein
MRDWLIKDFHWKAFSLLMAFGIWLTVRKDVESPAVHAPTVTKNTYGNVPVLAVSANAIVHQAQMDPQSVNVTVSGPSEMMDNLNTSQIHAFVNLTGFGSAQDLACEVEITLPLGATVVEVEPPQVTVTIPKQP